jgi:hypothetical protein
MKNVKIFLSAIAVFAIVGGALAFKAVKQNKVMYTLVGETCPSITSYQTTPINGVTPIDLYTTNDGQPLQPCDEEDKTDGFFTND